LTEFNKIHDNDDDDDYMQKYAIWGEEASARLSSIT